MDLKIVGEYVNYAKLIFVIWSLTTLLFEIETQYLLVVDYLLQTVVFFIECI
jgi:hypothetical protein